MRAGAGIANEELRIAAGGGGEFGAVVKGTQMDADGRDGRRWVHGFTPIFTDFVLRGGGDFGAEVRENADERR